MITQCQSDSQSHKATDPFVGGLRYVQSNGRRRRWIDGHRGQPWLESIKGSKSDGYLYTMKWVARTERDRKWA
jgi:hypothetical protein